MSRPAQSKVIGELINATKGGRTIIPLLGAGISIESGILGLSGVTQYLAKVQHYISEGLYVKPQRQSKRHPSWYVGDLGWPDPHRLNAALWNSIPQKRPENWNGNYDYRRMMEFRIQEELLNDISRIDARLSGILRALGRAQEIPKEHVDLLPDRLKEGIETGLWRLRGNWKTLLAHLTNANPDYVDTLFQVLIKNRRPGMSHRFLAFLTPRLRLRLFLTTNFDNLLEEALRIEGFRPFVYEVSRDSPLPHPSLLQEELSVVKLHGGAFGLRVGESLDTPLDEDSKQRLRMYLPKRQRPLLLVMGLGGWDRRIIDLVELIARPQVEDSAKDDKAPAVCWLHFEEEPEKPVKDLAELTDGKILTERVQNPGSFLAELHSRLTASHPSSRHPYSASVLRPVKPSPSRPASLEITGVLKNQHASERPIQVFLESPADFSVDTSLGLAHFVAKKAETHIPIWIDLDGFQTIAEVVVEIFRQLRRYDPDLSPIVLPAGHALDDPKQFHKPLRRLFDALSRGRYILAFNAVNAFGRPPTYHHGIPNSKNLRSRRERQGRFFCDLVEAAHRDEDWSGKKPEADKSIGPLKDSILAFSIDERTSQDTSGGTAHARKAVPELRVFSDYIEEIEGNSKILNLEELPKRSCPSIGVPTDDLLLISAFRRRRSLVALYVLLPEYADHVDELPATNKSKGEVDRRLQGLEEQGWLARVEGGAYWMPRKLRDHIYTKVNKHTRSGVVRKAIGQGDPMDHEPLAAMLRLAAVHDDVGDYYYSNLYAASQDLSAVLDYLYHRISSIRYLTKLQVWIGELQHLALPSVLPKIRGRLGRELVLEGKWEYDLEKVRRLRFQRLTALRRVLEREKERLLSGVSADILVDWADWIQAEDLPRFLTRTCLDPKARGLKAARRAVVELNDGSDQKAEHKISEVCWQIWKQLDDLKAIVLRDRADFERCTDLRVRAICRIAKITEPFRGWLDSDFPEKLLGATRDLPADSLRSVTEFLCDIWACHCSIHDREGAEIVGKMVKEIVRRSEEGYSDLELDRNLGMIRVQAFRHEAEFLLLEVNPWEAKGKFLTANRRLQANCHEAIRVCEQGLRIIGWEPADEYRRYRSYFHSLKGRAHYTLGQYAEAHRELDLSQASLSPNVGVDREMLGASLLRLAECLLARSDSAILESCLEILEKAQPLGDLKDLSTEGCIALVWEQIREDWEGNLKGKPYAVRTAMALKLAERFGGGGHLSYGKLRSLLEAEDQKHLDDLKSTWRMPSAARLLRELKSDGSRREEVEEVQRLSLENWSFPRLQVLEEDSQSLAEAIGRARRRLDRARDVLDEAEDMLIDARRNVKWWACLYQLRAQLQVELLLLQVTEIWRDERRNAGYAGTRQKGPRKVNQVSGLDWNEEKHRFIARTVNQLELGLRYLRQGLDVVLPPREVREDPKAPSKRLRKNLRIVRPIRLWIELMLVGAYLTREANYLSGNPPLEWEEIWGRWEKMCKEEGFFYLVKNKDDFKWFDLVSRPRCYAGGPVGRAFVLSSVRSCIRSGGLRSRLDVLVPNPQ